MTKGRHGFLRVRHFRLPLFVPAYVNLLYYLQLTRHCVVNKTYRILTENVLTSPFDLCIHSPGAIEEPNLHTRLSQITVVRISFRSWLQIFKTITIQTHPRASPIVQTKRYVLACMAWKTNLSLPAASSIYVPYRL